MLVNTFGEKLKVDKNYNNGKIKGIYAMWDEVQEIVYIGVSKDCAKRKSNHKSKVKNGKHEYEELNLAYKNKNLKFCVLQETFCDLEKGLEQFWLDYSEEFFEGFRLINKSKISDYSGKKRKYYNTNQRGQNNGNAKLKNSEVREIKEMIVDGFRNREIEKETGIKANYIAQIKNGYKWNSIKLSEEIEG